MNNICKQVRFTICAMAIFGSAGLAQTVQQPTAPPPTPPPTTSPSTNQDNTPGTDITATPPKISFGVRIEYFPERFFQTQYVTTSTTNPIQDSAYFGTSAGSKYTLGLTAEYLLTRRISVGLDFFYHQEEYIQLAQIKSGLKDPNSSYDNRPLTSITQDTRANYWDVPIVARYYGIRSKAPRGLGWLSQTFLIGGGAYRHVSNIRTGTSTTFPDTSTTYNEIPVTPNNRNLLGVVGGVGYKLFEYGKFKSMGEFRYTRWFGYTFQGPAYESQKNQLEIGLSFSY
ncbi:MAG TPA: hypothetical protein VK752_12055 [Bryobacteraceae bacterium]|jgi:hypothetical protein|nr:hypothetical protein [Bryobacteraceae bacterium]